MTYYIRTYVHTETHADGVYRYTTHRDCASGASVWVDARTTTTTTCAQQRPRRGQRRQKTTTIIMMSRQHIIQQHTLRYSIPV